MSKQGLEPRRATNPHTHLLRPLPRSGAVAVHVVVLAVRPRQVAAIGCHDGARRDNVGVLAKAQRRADAAVGRVDGGERRQRQVVVQVVLVVRQRRGRRRQPRQVQRRRVRLRMRVKFACLVAPFVRSERGRADMRERSGDCETTKLNC